MTRKNFWLLVLFVAIAVLAPLALEDAWGRVGGGQTSRGSSSSSSSSGSSGGSSSDGDILMFLIFLAIDVPIIGVPLLLLFIGFVVVRFVVASRTGSGARVGTHAPPSTSSKPARAPRAAGSIAALRKADEGFSMPAFEDFVQLLHRRATAAAVGGSFEPLSAFVSPEAAAALVSAHTGRSAVRDVVLGGIAVRSVQLGARQRIVLTLQGTREEVTSGPAQRVHVTETWTLERDGTAVSLAPEDMLRMGCPSCASALETDTMGRCKSCGTAVTKGQLQWIVTAVEVGAREPYKAPEVGLLSGGDEPSYRDPVLIDPNFGAAYRSLFARHPDLDPRALEERVRSVYFALQAAWSAGKWDDARPFVTDPMYETLRFWMEGYALHGLQNKLDDVKLEKQQIVKIDVDAWYEAVTIRVWGSMKDSTIEVATGKVVGGNATKARRFSEYWTFLRAAGTGGATSDSLHCPSCGANLDKISNTGVCGYCDTRITSGRFDWVLSRIHQTAEYQG